MAVERFCDEIREKFPIDKHYVVAKDLNINDGVLHAGTRLKSLEILSSTTKDKCELKISVFDKYNSFINRYIILDTNEVDQYFVPDEKLNSLSDEIQNYKTNQKNFERKLLFVNFIICIAIAFFMIAYGCVTMDISMFFEKCVDVIFGYVIFMLFTMVCFSAFSFHYSQKYSSLLQKITEMQKQDIILG